MKDIAKSIVFIGIFAIPFIPLIVSDSMFFPFITGKNFTFRILVEIIFASWIILAFYEPAYRPKFSWILAGFTGFVAIMLVANLQGEYLPKSIWSNFERMEGYVAIVHTFLYFLVVGSVLTTEKLWNRYLATFIAGAVLVGMVAFAQMGGFAEHRYQGFRADGTLGNATYMAVYMLFTLFISILMLYRIRHTKETWLKYLLGLLIVTFVFLLIQTATRGTTLGMIGGLLVAGGYIGLFAKEYPQVRKVALGGLIVVVVASTLFYGFRDTSFIQENRYLARIANISLEAGETRFTIWGMALEGVKERSVLGWGQGNFNYVFNKQYEPSLHSQEAWFDRVHNIVMDWLIAGGILGLLSYFSIIAAAVYYLAVRPLLRVDDESFSVTERGILLGLLAGYVFHNLFVFDNIVSYMYFAAILGYIHSRVAQPIARVESYNVNTRVTEQVAAPVVAIALVVTVYLVNVPGILAARDIIRAFQANDPQTTLDEFQVALDRDSFADQEIIEQLTRRVQDLVHPSSGVPDDMKQEAFKFAETELLRLAEEKPNDARVHVFISSFYRATNNIEPAVEHLARARELSPQKQQIIFEQGLAEMQRQEYDAALAFFKEAYELAPDFDRAAILYATAAEYAGNPELTRELIADERRKALFADNDLAVRATYDVKDYELLIDIFERRIAKNPQDIQTRVSLAVIYEEMGDVDQAIGVLTQAAQDIPSFKEQSQQFIAELLAGRLPGQPQTEVSIEDANGQKVEVENVKVRPVQP